ncbi:efflux RND transporter permease subunit [Flaviaesturariibacter amylovorans]|uniref:Efflux RND transporter permease subunit n=1 Tax=Flaviaesturariibacter amylovorans TaxID=1084520 RepID=A0ABP8G475_9BACT
MKKLIEGVGKKFKQFPVTSWAVDNRTVVYILAILISAYGLVKFNTLPKEQFPDIVVPTVSIITVHVGNSPSDIENLVTRPIEKQIKSISGAKVNKVNSISQQDYSLITVEFDTDVKTDIAKQKVKDAVDKARGDLPNDLTQEPDVQEFSFSEFPIMYLNISGNYDAVKLKKFADDIQDRVEELKEITRADIVGAPEREIQVNVDPYKMQAARITFNDIDNAIKYENNDISGGQIEVGNMRRTLRVKGQFDAALDLRNVVVKNTAGAPIYLRDIAEIRDTVKEKESYARLDGKPVITINIVKRSGENLIDCADKVKATIATMQKTGELPPDLRAVFTGDMSKQTKTSFNELVNTIIIGFILVLVVLMFFMGVTNAFFVALSVPLSVFVAFLFLPVADWIVGTDVTLNFIVLFALLFGLGIIVDDAIVVIENTHRIYANGKVPIVRSAKEAAGEVWIPVLAGTLTTLAPFFPLLFWKGLIGKFMIYLPTMLILTLAASLIVAFVFNPVFAVSFMHPEGKEHESPKKALFRRPIFWVAIGFGLLFHLAGWPGVGNFLLFMAVLSIFNVFVLRDVIHYFQNKALPSMMNRYEKLLRWVLHGRRPVWLLVAMFLLFPISLGVLVATKPGSTFFPSGDPNFIYTYLKLPVGTDVKYTDSVTQVLERRIYKVLEAEKPGTEGSMVESIISNVAVSATPPEDINRSIQSNLGRVQVSFVEFDKRGGKATLPYIDKIRKAVQGIPGAEVTVASEAGGPQTDPPVNVEVIGDNFSEIARVATDIKNYIDTNRIEGIERLRTDVDLSNPEISITIDRERAMAEGISTAQIGMELRTAVFGREVSKLKEGEEEYKIQLRSSDLVRNNITDLMNMRLTFRDFTTGAIKQIPLSAVARRDNTTTSGGIRRKNLKRTIQLQSNVLVESETQRINDDLALKLDEFKRKYKVPSTVTIRQSGVSEQQAETMSFLVWALVTALLLIFLILVMQFNSMAKSFIVLTEIFFSIIGVLIGYALTGMTIAMIMFGVGIVGLAGIVVKNGILLIEFTDELRGRGMRTREAAVQAGKIRIIPVLLTALATMLGLLPLAVGFNIDFARMFSELNPHIFFGGDSVVFWGPLSWTIIFGLIFAFFMTLVMVPSMYLMAERLRRPMERFYGTKFVALLGFLGPLFFLTVGIMYGVRRIQGKRVWMGQQRPRPMRQPLLTSKV